MKFSANIIFVAVLAKYFKNVAAVRMTNVTNLASVTGKMLLVKVEKLPNMRNQECICFLLSECKILSPINIKLNEAVHEIRRRKERERLENCHIEVIFDVIQHLAKQNVTF